MEQPEQQIIAACGIECSQCTLRRASLGDLDAAEGLAKWWRSEGWMKEDEGATEVVARGPHCLTCRGDRSKHWSPDCAILKCCVDDKDLEHCSECDLFACEQLEAWAQGNERYTQALSRLRSMRDGATA